MGLRAEKGSGHKSVLVFSCGRPGRTVPFSDKASVGCSTAALCPRIQHSSFFSQPGDTERLSGGKKGGGGGELGKLVAEIGKGKSSVFWRQKVSWVPFSAECVSVCLSQSSLSGYAMLMHMNNDSAL